MEQIKYKNEYAVQYAESAKISANCNAIMFINTGLTTAYVQGIPVVVGANLVFAGNQNEIDVTEYDLDFKGSTTGQLTVTKKINL